MTIVGQTNTEAILAANYPMVKKATVENDGTFYLTIELPLPAKVYNVVISASTEGKTQSLEKFKIIQQVDETRYIQEAVKVKANQWAEINQISQDKIIAVEGNVIEITEMTDDKKSFILDIDSANIEQIKVEYYGDIDVKVGKEQEFFGYIIINKKKPMLISHVGL